MHPGLVSPRGQKHLSQLGVKLPMLPAGVGPASASMHMSALYHKDVVHSRQQTSTLGMLNRALEQDKTNLVKKYGDAEPKHLQARFHSELPQKPQNEKYCWRKQRAQASDDGQRIDDGSVTASAAPEFPGSLRFNMQTLQSWFRDIDRDDSGVITQRELIICLRKQQDLLDMLCSVQSGASVDAPDEEQRRRSAASSLPAADRKNRENMYRIREILKDVDTDGSGSMEWDEFVAFFRRAGLLLEYKTQKGRNRTSLCDILDAQRAEELDLEIKRSETARRGATQTPKEILKDLDRLDEDCEK